jgi:Pilus biogenesis CpaD protein (pilus_cpaD)
MAASSRHGRARRLRAFAAAFAAMAVLAGCGGRFPDPDLLSAPAPLCSAAQQSAETWRPGCATRRNLAAIAAYPEDLYIARREGPRDAMRRDAVIAGYAQSRANTAAPAPSVIGPAGGTGSTQ